MPKKGLSVRFKRVYLVFPDYGEKNTGALHPPLGLGYLAEALRRKNIECGVADGRVCGNDETLRRISRFSPDLVGVSMMTLLYKSHYALAERIKDVSAAAVIAGGPHVSTFREKVLKDCSAIDYGAILEGEDTLSELCEGLDRGVIKGLLYRVDGSVVYTGDRPPRDDLDAIPFPTYSGFEMDRYLTDEIGILTSRGCPYMCTYCPVEVAIGRRYRMRSPENIASEVEYWSRKGFRRFDIIDDNFTFVKKRVYEFCAELARRSLTGAEFKCGNGVRADKLDVPLLRRMKEAGFRHISIGVEAGNDSVLKNLRKGETIDVIKTAIKDACETGFEVTLFFLVGSPGETLRDLEDSINIALSYPIFDARFYNIIPFPRTELFEWLKERGYLTGKPEDYLNDFAQFDSTPLFSTPQMSLEERKTALARVKMVRKAVRKRAMERKLKLGPLGSVAARMYVSDYMQRGLAKSRTLRMTARAIYERIAG
jgi:radical SAM superfamily enzyme YgiQ (UPF0313 family)